MTRAKLALPALLLLVVAPSCRPRPQAVDVGGLRTAMDGAKAAVTDLRSNVDRFEDEDWRDVVPDVEAALSEVETEIEAAEAEAEALETDLDSLDCYPKPEN